MKKYLSRLVFFFSLLFVSCHKEADLKPSPPVVDPFIRYDNPNSQVDHAIFLVYQQTQVPILYTDTIQANPLTILNVNYNLTGTNSQLSLRYLNNSEDILTGISFVQNAIIPSLGGSLKPYSVTIVDSLILQSYDPGDGSPVVYILGNSYQGLNTLVIGNIPGIKDMDSDQVRDYKADIFNSLLTAALFTANSLGDFYQVSAGYYYSYIDPDHGYSVPVPVKETFGFISDGTEDLDNGYYIQDKAYDLNLFLDKYLTLTDQEFQDQYGAYPLVMSKYAYLQKAVTALGFKKF